MKSKQHLYGFFEHKELNRKCHCTKNLHQVLYKFCIKDFFSKCEQIRSFLRTWLYLLKKSLMENFIFCAVLRLGKHKLEYH